MKKIEKMSSYGFSGDRDKEAREKINEIVEVVNKLINKPVTTTKEQPKRKSKFKCKCLVGISEKRCKHRQKIGFCDNLIGD